VQKYLFAHQISVFIGKICIYICNYFDVLVPDKSKIDFQFLQIFRFLTFVCKSSTNFIIGMIQNTSEILCVQCVYML